MSVDIVFLKAWIPVTVPQLYNPVTSLLLPADGKDAWKGMKTVGELKRDRGIQNTVNPDHLYRVCFKCCLAVSPHFVFNSNFCHACQQCAKQDMVFGLVHPSVSWVHLCLCAHWKTDIT